MSANKDLILGIVGQGATLAASIEQSQGHTQQAGIITAGAQVAATIVQLIAAHAAAKAAADASSPVETVTEAEVLAHFAAVKTHATQLILEAQASLASREPENGVPPAIPDELS
jgi:hypothetical protein